MFDLDIVNIFSRNTVSLLRDTCNIEIYNGNITIHEHFGYMKGVIAFVEIIGDLQGKILISMEEETSCKLASALSFEDVSSTDDIQASMKELVNMIAGSTINSLSLFHINLDITPPAIVVSDNLFMLEKERTPILFIRYETSIGNIYMNLILFNSKF